MSQSNPLFLSLHGQKKKFDSADYFSSKNKNQDPNNSDGDNPSAAAGTGGDDD